MNTCKKCGAPMLTDSKFCGRCGAERDAPLPRVCPKCKSQVTEGSIFCSKCGARVTPMTMDCREVSPKTRTLVVSREAQFQCAGNTYVVSVNGTSLGKVPAGGGVRTTVASDVATVEIVCTTVMVKARRRLVLKLGDNPRVSFKTQWPGMILETVHDAQVLERG